MLSEYNNYDDYLPIQTVLGAGISSSQPVIDMYLHRPFLSIIRLVFNYGCQCVL